MIIAASAGKWFPCEGQLIFSSSVARLSSIKCSFSDPMKKRTGEGGAGFKWKEN